MGSKGKQQFIEKSKNFSTIIKMSDEELSPEEALLKRQRKERKDLQGKIQGIKKTASKGDKKKKKDVVDEIAKLETELNAKHEKELEEFKKNSASISLTQTPVENDSEVEKIIDQIEEVVDLKDNNKKVSKAQKRRDK